MRHSRPPAVETMRRVQSPDLWLEASAVAPTRMNPVKHELLRALPDKHPDDALGLIGVRLKSCYADGKGYRYYGKLIKFPGEPLQWQGKGEHDADVVVMSTMDREHVWFGSVAEYEAMWCVD